MLSVRRRKQKSEKGGLGRVHPHPHLLPLDRLLLRRLLGILAGGKKRGTVITTTVGGLLDGHLVDMNLSIARCASLVNTVSRVNIVIVT
mmetsp:Transcript_6636/g.13121  ORF Transcript_6636/g.13121 Transcript_6636/m.13121 type:complete len:89 (-) Transcript_6636:564-830(-)